MQMSKLYCPTVKETPAEAEVISHKLMLRAALMRRVAAGIYSFLPLGYKVIRRIETIIREELEKAGAQEVHLPILHPGELWQESGRWGEYGPELVKFKDRKKRDFCLGPTHEEIITDLVRHELRSYKDLPVNLFQIQTKIRDEIRPRFGVMRAREFSMKDAYSFHADEASLEEGYQKMYQAYKAIFDRCGLKYRVVEADSGAIGGDSSHEFMVLAESGEDEILVCNTCDYAANVERATSRLSYEDSLPRPEQEKVSTPNLKSINAVAKYLQVPPQYLIKALLFKSDRGPIMALSRGNQAVNIIKLKNATGAVSLELIEESYDGLPVGFLGPQGVDSMTIVADLEVMKMDWAVIGANETDYHIRGIVPGSDFQADIVADIRLAADGERCPRCDGILESIRGIEVGHIFKLGTKYSHAMQATFLDEEGLEKPLIMGCYGIGVTRTVAAAIEQNHDEKGIKWPLPLAPYQVILLNLGRDEAIIEASRQLYQKLQKEGVEVLWDDRDERAGVKFNEADLLGIPLRVIVGRSLEKEGTIEVKERNGGKEYNIPWRGACERLKDILADI